MYHSASEKGEPENEEVKLDYGTSAQKCDQKGRTTIR